MAASILIVEDDPVQRRILEDMVRRFGHDAMTAEDALQALDILLSPAGRRISLILLDLVMPEMDGIEFLEKISGMNLSLPVIVQTAQGSVETVVQAMRAGADDFVIKPVNAERLRVSIQNLLKVNALTEEVRRLNKKVKGIFTFDDIIAVSPAMQQVVRLGRRAAQSNIPVLIEGESGVGKEVVARAIHGESQRAGRAFVAVNCGAIPENLVESTLFGHEKGAFTGATARHIGKFQEASGGTLFLDEVGELPLEMQVKLLRALQEGEIDPVGARRPVQVDVRIISATNRDMIQMVKDGQFREDLFYRLNVFPIMVPPLRKRQADIAPLVEHFIHRFSAEEGRKVRGVTPRAMQMLMRYSWPGNVRQLENAVFRAIVLADSDMLDVHDFPQIATQVEGFEELAEAPASALAPAAEGKEGAVAAQHAGTGSAEMIGDGMALGIPAVTDGGHVRTLQEIEADMIRLALKRYRGQMSEVARKLGIGRSTLYRKIKALGIDTGT